MSKGKGLEVSLHCTALDIILQLKKLKPIAYNKLSVSSCCCGISDNSKGNKYEVKLIDTCFFVVWKLPNGAKAAPIGHCWGTGRKEFVLSWQLQPEQ
ncbi:hypothetical protein V6N11_061233 [Hibiscus sabdariffa]|uniref:Uncharacterized protein n=1 Tax=Hibiscus sabdariffa TaxID=183260 RepID=A0ABR2NVA2_9ROSI